MSRAVTIAGVSSGCGKTSVALGLAAALRRRGLCVQPFKVGPDFIDPGLHAVVCGRPSVNLDGWMMGRTFCRSTFARHAADADVAVIEGVMGLLDGKADADGSGSVDLGDGTTAEIAALMNAPVLLVVDAGAVSAGAAAVVRGFEEIVPRSALVGVVFNRLAGPAHERTVRSAAARWCRTPVLGCLPRRADVGLPSRHLGLVTGAEGVLTAERIAALADWLEAGLDVAGLLEQLPETLPDGAAGPTPAAGESTPVSARPHRRVRVGIARDEAFSFYYTDNLRLLAEAGVDWVEFSPLRDRGLPADLAAVYLGGGYPELHAPALAAGAAMRSAIREFVQSGRPVWAECGGLMYLGRSLRTVDGLEHPMCGVFPVTTQMERTRQALGYVRVAAAPGHPLLPADLPLRGHEFHYSRIVSVDGPVDGAAYVRDPSRTSDGYRHRAAVGSYVHVHLGGNPAAAADMVSRLGDDGAGR